MFRVTAERRNAWKHVILLEEKELICCRHFSLAQFNEIRLQRGCRFNILLPGATPDMYLPGQENPPGLPIYEEP
jgi:hypothetical protein